MSQIPPLANTFELASQSSNCFLLVNFSSATFIRQLSWWCESVVEEDCNFSNFGNKEFLVSCYLGHRFCTRCLTGEIHGDDKTQIMILALFRRWSSKSPKSSTERLIVYSFRSACLHVECMTANKNTRKDNLSVILSSLPLSHRFMLSLSRELLFHDTQIPAAVKS